MSTPRIWLGGLFTYSRGRSQTFWANLEIGCKAGDWTSSYSHRGETAAAGSTFSAAATSSVLLAANANVSFSSTTRPAKEDTRTGFCKMRAIPGGEKR